MQSSDRVRARIEAQAQLRDAAARFVASCTDVSDGQWVFKPSPAAWSMAQISEHVAISNRNIHSMLTKRLLDSPIAGRATGVIDAEIPYLFYRGDEPPNVGTPSGTWTDRQLALERFDANAHSLLEWSDGTDADLRAVGLEHPVFGLLDGVQWLLFAAAHIERHRAQLIALARHPELPAQPTKR